MNQITYNATETAKYFHADDSFVRLLLGPVGCGKSVANCAEIMRRAFEQEAASDGIRYSRWAIVRNTYPELKATTIRTWKMWYPEKIFGKIKYDSPITQTITVADVNLEIFFLPLCGDEDLSKLKSLELTGIYFNELQFFSELMFEESLERLNRYPSKTMGCGITWTGAIADTNPPHAQHWLYKRFEIQKPSNQNIFKYEPAVLMVDTKIDNVNSAASLDGTLYVNNKNADYVHIQQDPNYWLKLVENHTDDTIRVNYQGQYGLVRKNKKVYPEYNDKIHCSEGIRYEPISDIILGWDFGRTPCVIVAQQSVHGYLMAIGELCSEDMGLDEFCGEFVIPYLNSNFIRWRKSFVSIGDPAGIAKNPTDDKCCFDILRKHGIITRAGRSNSFTPRRESVSFFLRKMVSGKPSLLISPKCIKLRQGFNGDYYYNKVKISYDERYKEEPDKNEFSHPHDAFQYICMHIQSFYEKPKSFNSSNLSVRVV